MSLRSSDAAVAPKCTRPAPPPIYFVPRVPKGGLPSPRSARIVAGRTLSSLSTAPNVLVGDDVLPGGETVAATKSVPQRPSQNFKLSRQRSAFRNVCRVQLEMTLHCLEAQFPGTRQRVAEFLVEYLSTEKHGEDCLTPLEQTVVELRAGQQELRRRNEELCARCRLLEALLRERGSRNTGLLVESDALEELALTADQQQHRTRTTVLNRLTKLIVEEISLERLCTTVAAEFPSAVGAQWCIVAMAPFPELPREESVRRMTLHCAFGRTIEAFDVSGSACANAFLRNEPCEISGSEPHESMNGMSAFDAAVGFTTCTALSVPISDRTGLVLGAVLVVNKLEHDNQDIECEDSGDNKNELRRRSVIFDSRDSACVKSLCRHLGVAVENLRLSDVCEAAERRSKLLLDVTRTVLSSQKDNLETLLRTLVAKLTEVAHCERCTIYFADHESKELSFRINFKGDEIRFPMGTGLAGEAASTGRTINIVDAYEDARFNREVDRSTGYRTRSVLCIPLRKRDGSLLAVCQLLNKLSTPRTTQPYDEGEDGTRFAHFSREDQGLLVACCNQVSVTLESAYLRDEGERAQRRLDTLVGISKDLATFTESTVMLSYLAERLEGVLGVERIVLYIHRKASGTLVPHTALVADADTEVAFPDDCGIAGQVFTTARLVNTRDARSMSGVFNAAIDDPPARPDATHLPKAQRHGVKASTLLCVPVHDAQCETLAGVCSAVNKRVGRSWFSTDDERMLALCVQHVGVALESTRVAGKTKGAQRRNVDTLRLANALTAPQCQHLRGLQEHVAVHLAQLVDAESARLVVFPPGSTSSSAQLRRAELKEVANDYKSGELSPEQSAVQHARLSGCVEKKEREVEGTTTSIVACPVFGKQDTTEQRPVLGTLLLRKRGKSSFGDEDISLIEACGEHIAAALASALVNESNAVAQRRSEVLLSVAQAVTAAGALSVDALVSTVIEKFKELCKAERCALFMIDHETKELFFRPKPGDPHIRFPMSKGLAGAVATTGRALNISDAYQDKRFNPAIDRMTGFRTRAVLCTPIFKRGPDGSPQQTLAVVQMVNKQSSDSGAWSYDRLRLDGLDGEKQSTEAEADCRFDDVFDADDERLLASCCQMVAINLSSAVLAAELAHAEADSERSARALTRMVPPHLQASLLSHPQGSSLLGGASERVHLTVPPPEDFDGAWLLVGRWTNLCPSTLSCHLQSLNEFHTIVDTAASAEDLYTIVDPVFGDRGGFVLVAGLPFQREKLELELRASRTDLTLCDVSSDNVGGEARDEELASALGMTASRVLRCAQLLVDRMRDFRPTVSGPQQEAAEVRIGVGCGSVTAGTVGVRYAVVGKALDIARRLEMTSRPGRVHVSEEVVELCENDVGVKAAFRMRGLRCMFAGNHGHVSCDAADEKMTPMLELPRHFEHIQTSFVTCDEAP